MEKKLDKILISEIINNDNKKQEKENKAKIEIIEIIDIDSYKQQNKEMFYKSNREIQLEENVCCESCIIC